MRCTQLIIDLNNIQHNIDSIKKYLGNNVEIMPVVKANGYGTYLNYCSNILNQFKYVAVALLDEAIMLRNNGYVNNIFILYPLSKEELKIAGKEDFIINGSNIFQIIDSNISRIRIHIEIETGMGRTGLQEHDVMKYINKLKHSSNIIVDGIFTHLSSSGSDISFSLNQISKFEKIVEKFARNDIHPKYKHFCCSGGLKNYRDYTYNMVRIGLLIYGYYPNDTLKNELSLKPSMVLKTNISFLKNINAGETVGYNKNFIAKEETKVATIPFGFADGLIGLETGIPYVIIKNKFAKIIGICMDNMMIDVTNIEDVKIGDVVYIWDNDKLTIEEVADWCNGICNYEVMSSISERVPRVFKS